MSRWKSLHFFIHDYNKINELLSFLNANLAPEIKSELFFIRYWLGGPHIRIRFKNEQHEPAIRKALVTYWDKNHFISSLNAGEYYKNYQRYFAADEQICWYENGHVEEIAYEPELTRYGGENGIAHCEAFFCWDTRNILDALNTCSGRLEQLLFGYCLVFHEVAKELQLEASKLLNLEGLNVESEVSFVTNKVSEKYVQHRTIYQGYVGQYEAQQLYPQHLTPLKNELNKLSKSLSGMAGSELIEVFNSILHMSFNRAGIAPFKEAVIRHFSFLALNDQGEVDAILAS
ncbi:thiopeptide-type bacteriocin biosynthesis protein [Pseudoalteromonas fenneropenaei]|uniref:Thiopeptide-type bacteriocin biosynthesis protein n=1 Tax=Pseudoalteromonas fenneropenaei TaxID=1737459 RepID=A0ABV7CKU3_9GAMM